MVEREESIRGFVKEPYYTVHILTEELDAVSDKYKTREEATALADLCMGQRCFVERITEEAKSKAAPKLYDLTSLQRDANRKFGFTALQTSEYPSLCAGHSGRNHAAALYVDLWSGCLACGQF